MATTQTLTCSVVLRTRCATRRVMERDGKAYFSLWDGLLYPLTEDVLHDEPFAWPFCPFCGGDVRLGIRGYLEHLPPSWMPEPWTPDEGDDE